MQLGDVMNQKILFIITSFAVLIFTGCAGGPEFAYQKNPEIASILENTAPVYPDAFFAVISDMHIYDPDLGTEGKAFQDYLADDRKLLKESVELTYEAVRRIGDSGVQFVLVSGDLTKDGAMVSHRLAANQLSALTGYGKKVIVVPGNHDILNPRAYGYEGDETIPVQNITPGEFQQMYWDLGYGEALLRHQDSLSYVTEPVPGLWVLAMDSCLYRENEAENYPVTNGRFTQETLNWIEDVLTRAILQEKAVLGVMHHGILEHYETQNKYFGEYVVDYFEAVSRMFASYNMRLVFTGHYHAQDVVLKEFDNGKWLYDVETGSLITYPSPVRYIRIKDNTALITAETIDSLPSFSGEGESFKEYSYQYVFSGIEGIAYEIMRDYWMREAEARRLAPLIAEAVVSHYAGDESFDGAPSQMLPKKGLSLIGRLVVSNRRPFVEGLWNDPEPADNRLRIDLGKGSWEPYPADN